MLERIQLNAAQVVTGGIRGTPNHQLYMETGWETLKIRRTKRKLLLMYTIMNNEVPQYLSEIIPIELRSRHIHNTRFSQNISHFRARSTTYYNSFFPSTVRLWNEIPFRVRQADHISIFEKYLSKKYKPPNKYRYFFFGNRYTSILYSQLRMGCSRLNSHLHKIGIRDTGDCACGANNEDAFHYFFYLSKL